MIASFAIANLIKVAQHTNTIQTPTSTPNDSITYVEPKPNLRLGVIKSIALTTEFSRGVD